MATISSDVLPNSPAVNAKEATNTSSGFEVEVRENKLYITLPHDQSSIAADQLSLRSELLRSAMVVENLFSGAEDRGVGYVHQLADLARSGLVGNCLPAEATRAMLNDFKAGVALRESGRVKHKYLKRLAKYAGPACAALLVLSLVAKLELDVFTGRVVGPIAPFSWWANVFMLLSGCMLGVWTSFALRNPTLDFDELHIPEPDQLHPTMKLAFAAALSMVIALLFAEKALTLGIGNISSTTIFTDASSAWLFGVLCGLSEQLMSQQIVRKTTSIFGGSAAMK